MNDKIVDKEPFQVIGKALEVTVKDDQNKKDIPAFWNELNHNGFTDSLKPHIGPLGFLGVCMDFNDQADTFNYVTGSKKQQPTRLPAVSKNRFPPQLGPYLRPSVPSIRLFKPHGKGSSQNGFRRRAMNWRTPRNLNPIRKTGILWRKTTSPRFGCR